MCVKEHLIKENLINTLFAMLNNCLYRNFL